MARFKYAEKSNGLFLTVNKILFLHQELDRDEEDKKKFKQFKINLGDDDKQREWNIRWIEKKLKKIN